MESVGFTTGTEQVNLVGQVLFVNFPENTHWSCVEKDIEDTEAPSKPHPMDRVKDEDPENGSGDPSNHFKDDPDQDQHNPHGADFGEPEQSKDTHSKGSKEGGGHSCI